MKNTIVTLAVVALALLGLGASTELQNNQGVALGGMTNFDGLTLTPVDSTDGLRVGPSGTSPTTHKYIASGTFTNTSCTGAATQVANAATTYYCSVTNSVNGDVVFVSMSSTTPYSVFVNSVHASTTGSNQLVIRLANASSTAAATATTTGARYLIFRPI